MKKRKIVRKKERLERIDNINRTSKDLIKDKDKEERKRVMMTTISLLRIYINIISAIFQAGERSQLCACNTEACVRWWCHVLRKVKKSGWERKITYGLCFFLSYLFPSACVFNVPGAMSRTRKVWKEARLRTGYEYDWQTTTNLKELRSHAFPDITPLGRASTICISSLNCRRLLAFLKFPRHANLQKLPQLQD